MGPARTLPCDPAHPPRASELAALFPEATAEMRRVLGRRGLSIPPERYTFEDDGPELMRYAQAEGFLTAESAEQRAAVLNSAVQRIKDTGEWLLAASFMRPRDMRALGNVVRFIT